MSEVAQPASTLEADRFRHELRSWLESNCPDEMRSGMTSDADVCWGGRNWTFSSKAQRLWLERMAAAGYTAPEWPVEYGGAGLSSEQSGILAEEVKRIGTRAPLFGMGLAMIGPALLKYGSESQKRLHLTQIARGEIRWCQGYSEPGAGSDLASLRTKAKVNRDHLVVSGQKVWTSLGHISDWMFCLVRTDSSGSKHHGISFVLIDMATPGIEVRPITLISGKSQFCETFLDDVKVPIDNIVGGIHEGWSVAKYLLLHERTMVGATSFSRGAFVNRRLGHIVADAYGGQIDDALRCEIARVEVEAEAVLATARRYKDEASHGVEPGPRASALKYAGTMARKRQYDLLVHAEGMKALEGRSSLGEDSYAAQWLRSRGNSIEGGTNEIMLNIISKAILKLPEK